MKTWPVRSNLPCLLQHRRDPTTLCLSGSRRRGLLVTMDTSLVTRRSHDEYWRPVNASIPRARPQSGVSNARNGRQATYIALWQQRQSRGRVQSSRPLGTPRCFVAPQRPPSGPQPRPPSAAVTPHLPNAPPSYQTPSSPRTTTILIAQPPSGPPPRPDPRNPILSRGRLPRRVLSSHFGGPQTKDIAVVPEKRVQLVSPPDFSAQDIVVAPPVPWRRLRGVDDPGMTEVKEEEVEGKEDDSKSEDESIFSQCDHGDDADSSSATATPPPPTPPKFIPRPPAEPPDGVSNIRSILKRARMREARLAPASSYLPSPMHGPVPQETELTEILTIRPKPMMPHSQRETPGRQFSVKQSDRGVRFDMANTEVFEIARRRPHRPTIFPDSFNLL